MSENQHLQTFLGRQPILGREQQLLAYELLLREGPLFASHRTNLADPALNAVSDALPALTANQALGPYRGHIGVDQEFLFSELIDALPPKVVVLEILQSVPATPEVIARCRELRDKGFALAVESSGEMTQARRKLLELAEIIRIDVLALDAARLAALVQQLKPFSKKLLAEKVESAAQVDLCMSLGFDLFQGYYFTKPALIAGRQLNPSQVALLRLLDLVLQDAETSEIENAFKVEPGLTVNMLRLTNSVSNGLTTHITSLRHAITILGRRQLQRWLQLLIYTNPKGGAQGDNPLLPLAATRGRLIELLAERVMPRNREFADQGFMVGIMSLMPALLGVDMEEILTQLPVAQRVKQALVEQTGPHGQLLQLVEATEQTDPAMLAEAIARQPGIGIDFLEDCLEQALYWANNLGREKTDE